MLTVALLTLSLIASTPEATTPEAAADAAPEAVETALEAEVELSDLAQLAADEVEGLHKFFHDWFVGELPDTDEAYARFADALAADFTIVTPSGVVSERDSLLERLRTSHASGKDQGIKIWIRGFQVRKELGDTIVVNYEEWQQGGSSQTGRVSTAILQRDESAPGGLVWLHLHETWLPRSSVEQMISNE